MNKILISSTSGSVYSLKEGGYTDNRIPAMTNNTSPSGVVESSSTLTSNYAWKSFDGETTGNNGWIARGTIGWISYEFNDAIKIESYTLHSQNSGGATFYMPRDWTFEGSNDGVNWDVLDTRTDETWEISQKKKYDFKNNNKYKRYRVNITLNNGSGSYTGITEIEMMESLPPSVKSIPSQTEQDFINHGMKPTQAINPKEKITQVEYINNQSSTLGNGKVFEQPIDKYIKSLNVE